ncbi:MAG: carbonic anhydrase [Candidatus Lokiarchaeota archaeon]|nr:carbonic anhydrase [Candidatus Lokiarchaeota archaeon]
MIKDIEKKFVEGNLKFKWKIMQDLESIKIRKNFPKYPVLILTCMDPRININEIFQLNSGDVFVLRNAGNIYTIDVLRSILLTIFKYKVKYVIILGHLDCGMLKINLTELRQKLPSKFLSSLSKNYTDLLPKLRDFFKPILDEIQNIKEQIKSLEKIKDFYPEIEITGMLYDIKTGLVFEYEKFKDYRDIEDFKTSYKGIIINKKHQFTEFLGKIEEENVTIDDSNDLSQEKALNEGKSFTIAEIKEEHKNISILGQKESKEYDREIIHMIIPKIKVPKIKFHGVKIYIPKNYNNKKEIVN